MADADTRPKTRMQAEVTADHVVELVHQGEDERARDALAQLDDWLAAQVDGGED